MKPRIRIVVIDDHLLFREGLIRLLAAEKDFEVVGAGAGLREARELISVRKVDLLLLDYDLGPEQALPIVEETRRMEPPPKVLMVTAGMNRAGMVSILDSGASGIFLKHSPPSQLVEAIRTVAEGEMWLDPRAVRPVIETVARSAEPAVPHSALTPREKAVLRGVLEGHGNKIIAATMNISESSVKAVLQQLFAKTGVRTRSQLVRLALERHSHDWLEESPEERG